LRGIGRQLEALLRAELEGKTRVQGERITVEGIAAAEGGAAAGEEEKARSRGIGIIRPGLGEPGRDRFLRKLS